MLKKLAILLDPESEMGGDQTGGDDARPPEDRPGDNETLQDFVKRQTGHGEAEDGDAQKLGETEKDDAVKGLGEDDQSKKDDGDDEEEETPVKKKGEGDTEKDDEDAEPEDKAEEGEEEKPKDPVPYERFEEINTKYRDLESEVAQTKPLVEHHRKIMEYCDQNNITDDQFRQALEVQALLNTNPEEALKRLLPIVEAVQGFTGDRLPADLQKRVDQGTLELTDAREIASLRAKSQFGAGRFDQYQKKFQEEQMQRTQRAMNSAMATWVDSKLKLNPDFKAKAKEEDVDGIYEFVVDRYIALVSKRDSQGKFVNPCTTPEHVTQILERAYNEVTKAMRPAMKKKTIPNLSSVNGSKSAGGGKRPEDAGSLAEVVRNAAAGRY